jgi:hypothetical protein
MRNALFLPLAILALLQCAPRRGAASPAEERETDECRLMKEVCEQAYEFQKQFEAMPEEGRRDYVPVLNTYTQHCEDARESCRRSGRSGTRRE